jgi:hypothetical protein
MTTIPLDDIVDIEFPCFVGPRLTSRESWPILATELQHYISGRDPLDRMPDNQQWVLRMMQLHIVNRRGRVMHEGNESPLSETPALVHLTMKTAGLDDELTEVFLVDGQLQDFAFTTHAAPGGTISTSKLVSIAPPVTTT